MQGQESALETVDPGALLLPCSRLGLWPQAPVTPVFSVPLLAQERNLSETCDS